MRLLAGVGWGGSVEPPALVLSTLPWPKAPPANLKGPKESPLNPPDAAITPHMFSAGMTSSFAQRGLELGLIGMYV